ncbi:MAG: YggS family pyridoxal phosphate-dependent enzyme [Porticoccaceae bacterium]|jgi:pyridoxal phosphate enzyme (YggS family)
MVSIEKNITSVKQRIDQAVTQAGRDPKSLKLLAVSKTRPASDIEEAFIKGLSAFGENYLQEAIEKINSLATLGAEWHFIGPLQSNKTRQVAEHFDWVHSVDRIKIAKRLSEQRPDHLPPINICLQVNIDAEPSKSGVLPEDAIDLALIISDLPNIHLRGLMAIPKASSTLDAQRQPFRALRLLKEQVNQQLDNSQKLDTLSMGMSGDIEAAILEGSTILRVGTDIFGPRANKINNNGNPAL